jgi:ABC-2 type transport system permease protein
MVMAGPVEDSTLENLYSILEDYNVMVNDGILVEADRNHYAFQRPYILIPDMNSDSITDSLIEANYYPIMPIALGLTTTFASSNVTDLLVTSDDCFSKIAGYALSTYEKEDGDVSGPFTVAVSIEAGTDGKIVWFSSSAFLEDSYNAYSSGANGDLAMNALSSLIGEREALAIRSKSLNYNYLTISESQGSVLKAWMIGILPLMYLGIGICVVAHTRRKQNETV